MSLRSARGTDLNPPHSHQNEQHYKSRSRFAGGLGENFPNKPPVPRRGVMLTFPTKSYSPDLTVVSGLGVGVGL